MEFNEGIRNRRAIRKFQTKQVTKKVLESVFDLAKWVPVIDLFHQWSYHVIQGEKRDRAVNLISQNTVHLRDLLEHVDDISREKALNFYPDLGGAPVIILQTIPIIPVQWDRKYMILISGVALSVLLNSIHCHGLGACGITVSPWVEDKLRSEYGLEDRELLTGLAVGYPAESPEIPAKSPEQVLYL